MGLISADNDKALSIQYLKNRIIKRRASAQKLTGCDVLLFIFLSGLIKGEAYYKFIFYILIFCSFARLESQYYQYF